ncbi:MAG: GNAT family N-acetyltransferase [Gemmatimonadetes bacterium]|nr:GNAT family N-acetyltransferase [Gemmatimonadota bacterium]
MTTIDPYQPADRAGIHALYARVFGAESATAFAARWDWLYQRNPALGGGLPRIWVAHEGGDVVGQYATMPVRLAVLGREIDAAWGCDVMAAPEQQGKGLGPELFRTWDAGCGAAIGLSLTDASHKLFQKLHWPFIGAVPRFAKALSPRARERFGERPPSLVARVSGGMRAILGGGAAPRARVVALPAFGDDVTRLWERVAPAFAFAVRRDAPYLSWRFGQHPTVRYEALGLERDGALVAWAVYRHVSDDDWQVTVLVDFLADPADAPLFDALLAAVHDVARSAGSEVVRTFAMHAGFRAGLARAGYASRGATLRMVAKINEVPVPDGYYASQDAWHVTRGDSDGDR